MIVHFVNIGGIDDHHCLNFLFIAILDLFASSRIRYIVKTENWVDHKISFISWKRKI